MRRLVARCLLVVALPVASATARAKSPPSIAAMVADLQRMQTRIAAGDQAAYAGQKGQLRVIGGAIRQAPPETWKIRSERIAATIYVLSGGQPGDASQLMSSPLLPKDEATVLRGSVAYVLGRESEAIALFEKLDPRQLDLRLAGQVSFALSILQAGHNEARAIEYLDLARLLSPGTLVEEAALRREILLCSERRETERVASLARQYISRFGRSVYAKEFLTSFASSVAKLNLIDSIEALSKFHAVLRSLSPPTRSSFLLSVARAELISGKLVVAGAAANAALQDTPAGGADEARGRLYRTASQVFGGAYTEGVAALQAFNAAKLPANDKPLLEAVNRLVAQIHDAPIATAEQPPQGQSALPASEKAMETIGLVEKAMERTTALSQRKIEP